MKQIIFFLTAILLSTNVALAQTDDEAASLSVGEESYDFGKIKENGGKVSHTFLVKNDGRQPLVITRVIASCGCTTPEWTKEPIAPGKTGEILVTYDPQGRPGAFAKTVSIYSNGKKGSQVITIRGEVN
ncbi:MAG: DUF1573 domain-containing protein [Tannerellaceae bacterium]|jgi:archaellum component FlaG (FlaF/FlaG flagellin family)|nr:DUF1573 domain-containing protein [Tannerellaceae bacterium]